MDGRIVGEVKKPVSGNGAPAKVAKLELSSEKTVEACIDVTPELNRSSPPVTMPEKARTVSSMDCSLQQAPQSFDFRFVGSDDEVRQLLDARTGDGHQDVILISHPDDLSQANLVSRLSIAADGRHSLRSGKLFEGSQPLTLVMDIRKLTSDDLPKFNDLLDPDNPCLFDKVSQKKRPLGEHVALLVLAAPEQLAPVGQASGAPGADFWRRINRPGNIWQFDPQTGDDSTMDLNEVPPLLPELPGSESAMDDDNTVLIDCHIHTNWRQLLLGGPGVDQQGRIQHIPGRFESLRAGQKVILKGADWQDLAFEQTIRQMLAQKRFESNGGVCQLPDDVQFYQMPVENTELHSLFQSLSCFFDKEGDKEADKELDKEHAAQKTIIINQSNIRDWLGPIAIAPEGYAVPNTRLLEQVRAGGVVTVTSPLTEALWFCLLGSLQTIRETTGLKPRLQVAQSKRQPTPLGLTESDEYSMRDQAVFNTVTYQQQAQASYWINHYQKAPLIIQVNEQTRLSQLFDNLRITSEQKAHFGRHQSGFQEALTSGKPVVMRGLESNPTLQELLEPLVIGQPLLVNGQLQAYPQAQVTVLWPESAKSPSLVWRSMITTGKPCPEVDIWDINGDRHDIPRTELPEQALHQLYDAFKTVPAHLCNPLPEMTEGLLNNLILATRRAQQVDHSPQLLPRHWRKAINSVITHGTRQNPAVRDFMKVACWWLLPDACKKPDEHPPPSVDPDQLTAIINGSLRLDRTFVKQNLWPLARVFDPRLFKDCPFQLSYEEPFSKWDEKEVLDRFCAMIVAHAPEQQRQAMAHQLQVDPAAAPHLRLAIRPSRQIKRLQDALASGWQLPLSPGQTRSDAILALANDCFHMARREHDAENPDEERIERIEYIENRLSQSLEWQGSADQPMSALADDLYHGSTNQKDRESRRLSRLHDRLADSPVIFVQGETGTGKSYFSARMAGASGEASVLSLGPSDSEQTLMQRWQWQEHPDGDRSTEQQNRMLMEWARTPDKDGHYLTLVLDEANLAKTGLLASLNGLWEPEPCIYVNGHPVKVSSKHRVILTGNPDHYAGRQLDPPLKEKLPMAYYPPLDQAFLRDRVVEPALVKQLQRHLPDSQINDIAHITSESVMTLWQYYQELLPEHAFTPRDLTDICSWVGWYLDRALPVNDSVTYKQINGLIRQSFRDVLGPEIGEAHQDALTALEIWFAVRYDPDNTLSSKVHNQTTLHRIQQAFKTFTEQNRPDFDTSGSAVHELVQRLGQDLSRCQQAYHLGKKHDGRQATLIEGPAGRGKDAILNLMIQSVKQQTEQRRESMPKVFPLNACDCSWDKVCEKIQTAKVHGGIVVISEMNLIDSQHLEGELNDILAGNAHPGFHLFATINPPGYSGRKPLSPALKGRFRHLPIRQYSPAELQAIAGKVLPQNSQGKILAKQLTEKHCRLQADLKRKNLPLLPTSLDLQNAARAVIRVGDVTEEGLHQCLNQHYRLYLMAAKTSLEALPESSTLVMSNSALDFGLCEWFNQTVPGIGRPWLIRRSDFNSIDEKRHEIRVKADLNEEEARTEIIKRVAEARWQASGLSLNPDESDDILTQALYRHWQQRWFDHEFGQVGTDANGLFSLTKEQKLTLKMPASQPYLREADKRIEAWNAHGAKWWTAFWHQMNELLNHWVDESGEYTPQVQEKQAMTLDWETNYENEETPQVSAYKIFNTRHHPSHMHRQWARDIDVSAEGSVELIDLVDQHIHGVESLMPTRLPEHGQELTLASDQTLATLDISSDDGQYALPSLTANDYIVALRIEPDLAFTLIRDRYTGLHTLSVPAADAEQSIRCVYVLETRKPGKKTPAKEARPKRSTHPDTRCSEGMKTVLNSLFDNIAEQPSSKVRRFLRALKKARGTTQRIETITNYCRKFTGKAKPEKHKNFFKFLVTQRQGSCRHRVPVFIAFCRYFGISCRQIDNAGHCFAEYSVDGGQTWESVDLDGAPVRKTEITPEFQPTRMVNASSTETRKIKDLLKGADLIQQQTLAKACDVSPEELKKALETNSALPETHLSIAEMVRNLWLQKDLTGFAMGVSIIELLETKALGKDVMTLVGAVIIEDECRIVKPMSEAVRKILYENDEDRVTEQLRLLHSKLVVEAGASPLEWLRSMQNILKYADLAKPSVIHFAIEALESDWLEPLATYKSHIMGADEHHSLLVRLTRVDELKDKAAHCLKKWYREFFSKEKNSQVWQLAYKDFQKRKGDTLFVTHGHDGFSSFLEGSMTISSIQNTWTDQPGGIPNVERMLLHRPAFPKLHSGKTNRRPVIILGQPSWGDTVFNEKVKALYQRKVESSPHLQYLLEKIEQYNKAVDELHCALDDLKSEFHHTIYGKSMRSNQEYQAQQTDYENKKLDIENEHRAILKPLKLSREDTKPLHNLRDKCRQAIRQAFSHYLYEVTHSKAGHLTFCWARATIGEDTSIKNNYGAHNPSSPEELYAMISEIDTSSDFGKSVDNVFLQQTLNVSNALVLKSDELTKIAGEFLSSVNLNSIYESLDA